ncbi:hypothetical protein A3K89_14835 [Rhodococcoides kyotonense]|uniref:Uncharacterized protein n=2 Tax=Mycobacteriales TaxID=85007 RepID=A0A177YN15_9NOCA|nr:hypothetical protein A3K89_14835 [Rhodococcus kyotonensis]
MQRTVIASNRGMTRYADVGTTIAVSSSARHHVGHVAVVGTTDAIRVIPTATNGKIDIQVIRTLRWVDGVGGPDGIGRRRRRSLEAPWRSSAT